MCGRRHTAHNLYASNGHKNRCTNTNRGEKKKRDATAWVELSERCTTEKRKEKWKRSRRKSKIVRNVEADLCNGNSRRSLHYVFPTFRAIFNAYYHMRWSASPTTILQPSLGHVRQSEIRITVHRPRYDILQLLRLPSEPLTKNGGKMLKKKNGHRVAFRVLRIWNSLTNFRFTFYVCFFFSSFFWCTSVPNRMHEFILPVH